MDELERRWREVFDRYLELKAECEGRVARWEWASGQRYDLRPLYFERHRLARGKRLPAEPPERSGAYLYGFDATDRVVLARRFTVGMDYSQNPLVIALRGLKPVLQWSDQFLTYTEGGTEAVTYTQFEPRMPVSVAFLETGAGRLVSYRSLEMAIGPQIRVKEAGQVWDLAFRTVGVVRQREDYGYDGEGQLDRVIVRVDSSRVPPTALEHALSYEAGKLVEVTVTHPDGTVQRAYQKVKKGEGLPSLAKRVESRLLEAIPEGLAAAKILGRAYCVALTYQDRYAPPGILVGLERDRDRVLAKHGADARYYLFVPDRSWVEVRVPETDDYDLFEQQVMMKEAWDLAREMLRRVAGQLARRDWSGIMEVTPDFVVFAADYEADDIVEAIAASNEPARVAELRTRGWL